MTISTLNKTLHLSKKGLFCVKLHEVLCLGALGCRKLMETL